MIAETKTRAPAATGNAGHTPPRQARHLQYSSARPIGKLLSRFPNAKETAPGQYLMPCSAHADRTPSLSVRECSDGTLLLNCFAGCTASEILAAIGLELSDLFPDSGRSYSAPKSRFERRIHPADALRAIDQEALTVSVIASDMLKYGEIDVDSRQRLAVAVGRISGAREVAK